MVYINLIILWMLCFTDIDRIVTQIVKPKVSLYMAIDGVAPRAKLNQQRSRRFRSAKDMKDATKNAKSKSSSLLGNNHNGSDLAAESSNIDAFDSNCITPGTEFMARVSNTIKYFIRKKIQEDPLWRNLKVIFSGHEIPGMFMCLCLYERSSDCIFQFLQREFVKTFEQSVLTYLSSLIEN